MRSQEVEIWVIEDDEGCQFVYEEILSFRYRFRVFATLSAAKAALAKARPSLLLADLRLPDGVFLDLMDDRGFNLKSTPVIVVSSVEDIDVLRQCFQNGARDYLTKPFSKGELIVKIEQHLSSKASLRDRAASREKQGGSGLMLNWKRFEAKVREAEIRLTPKEMQILDLLRQEVAPVNREKIVSAIWEQTKVTEKTLDVHIFNLRKKLVALGHENSLHARSGL